MFLKRNWEVIGKEGKRYGYNDISGKSLQVCLRKRVFIFLSKEKKKPVALMSNATPKSVSFAVFVPWPVALQCISFSLHSYTYAFRFVICPQEARYLNIYLQLFCLFVCLFIRLFV